MFSIELTETAYEQLAAFKSFERTLILDAIKVHLRHQPAVETRNRKLLRENAIADWELRVQKYRVFYEIDPEQSVVRVVAVGYKEHNQLFIGGEEVEL